MENYENNPGAVDNFTAAENGGAAPCEPAPDNNVNPDTGAFEAQTPIIKIESEAPAAAPFTAPTTEPTATPAAAPFTAPTAERVNGQDVAPTAAPAQNFQPQNAPYFAPSAPVQNRQYVPAPAPQRFDYTPVAQDVKKRSNTGLKVFCAVLALVLCVTCAGSVGYFFGRRSLSSSGNRHSEVQLAARPATGEELTEAQVYEKVNESIVGIRVYNEAGESSDCSGVVYSEDGYIVSNDHIYAEIPNAKFKIYSYNGKEYDAEYVAGDQISDLTVLKISGAGLKAATFGDSEDLFCGEHVVAIGRPSNAKAASTLTSGVISLPSRRVKSTTNYSSNLIQTDSAINPGSSGGALINMYGQVIGITSSKLAGTMYDSVCFAIPSRTVTRVIEELIKEGKVVSRAKLGITYTEIDSVTAEVKKAAAVGLYIASVSNESDLYGKVAEGDIITHVNGIEITADTVMLDVIEKSRAGDVITVTVLSSNGSTADYRAKLLANIGTSSYTTGDQIQQQEDEAPGENDPDTGDGSESPKFNFPFGE